MLVCNTWNFRMPYFHSFFFTLPSSSVTIMLSMTSQGLASCHDVDAYWLRCRVKYALLKNPRQSLLMLGRSVPQDFAWRARVFYGWDLSLASPWKCGTSSLLLNQRWLRLHEKRINTCSFCYICLSAIHTMSPSRLLLVISTSVYLLFNYMLLMPFDLL